MILRISGILIIAAAAVYVMYELPKTHREFKQTYARLTADEHGVDKEEQNNE